MFNGQQHAAFAASPDGTLLGPPGGDIDAVNGINELALRGVAAMSDGVGFEKTGDRLIPLIGLNGDAFFDERAGFGGGTSALCGTAFTGATVCGCVEQADGIFSVIATDGAEFIKHRFLLAFGTVRVALVEILSVLMAGLGGDTRNLCLLIFRLHKL